MKPLLYLTVRTMVNGVKRALTNPRRLIAFLFAFGWIVRFVVFPSRGEQRAFDPTSLDRAGQILGNFDVVRILDAVTFAVFAFISIFLALGAVSNRNSFRPADVDVLFPTPVEPKLVLIFRIFRDYVVTLLAPLFFIIVGFRPASMGVRSLQRAAENPEAIQQTLRVAMAAWLLVALCWVCINYAASLFVNRSDLASTRNRRILGWSLAIVFVGVCGFITWQATTFTQWQDWIGLTEQPLLRIVFFTATLSMWTVHGMVQGEALPLLAGFGGLLAIILGTLRIAVGQAGWMYDQAAARGFDSINTRKLQQSGDTIGLMTAQARQGKIKAGPFAFISRVTPKGPWALVWKEALIGLRSTWFLVLLFSLIAVFLALIPLVAGQDERSTSIGYVFLFMQSMGIFMSASALAQAGFIEMLRRVDLQKPLPFSFSTTIFFEVLAKAAPGAIVAVMSAGLALFLRPDIWREAVASLFIMPTLAALICLVTCLTTILFPDFEDPTQRGFRGLMTFAGVLAACAPGGLAFVGMAAIGMSSILASLITFVINIGMALLVATVAGAQYGQFNPSE